MADNSQNLSPLSTSTATLASPAAPRPLRWKPFVAVISGLIVAILGVRAGFEEIAQVTTAVGILVIALITLVWFFVRAGFSSQVRLAGLAVLVGASAVAWASGVQFAGFRGAMWPDFYIAGGRTKDLAEFPAATPGEKPSEIRVEITPTPHDYPGFLGADRNATIKGLKLARDWKANPPKELWRIPVGLGWSSFAIVGNLAVTQEQRGPDELVVAYELQTGKEVWKHADRTLFSEALGGNGPRATPTLKEGRIFALGATGVLNCLEVETGKLVWSRDILKDAGAKNIVWGMSGSPLVYDQFVVVNPGGANGYSVVAYDTQTGQIAWHGGSGQAAYSSPLLATLAGVRQVVILNGPGLEGYGAEDGRELWNFDWKTSDDQMISVSQPVVLPASEGQPDRILISSGYTKGAALLEITGTPEKLKANQLWRSKKLRAKFTNVVVRNGYAYGLDETILACVDLKDGTPAWRRERAAQYDFGQVMLIDDVILVQAESGDVALVSATPDKFQELTRFSPLGNKTWNNPALSGRLLLVRNDREAVCCELPLAGE